MPQLRNPSLPLSAVRRAGLALLTVLVAVGSVVVAGAVGLGAGPVSAAQRCGGAVPGGHIRVVVVVDDGVNAPGATCLVLGPGEQRGSSAWAARAALLGTPKPRYAGSGLLCAIDGYPSGSECGDPSGGGYRYWSYWSGTSGSWVYGGGNPHARALRDGDIEGWRFVDGSEGGQNRPPRLTPSASLFPALPPPPPPASPPPAPAPAPSGGGASGGPSPSPGASGGPSGAVLGPAPSGTPGSSAPGAPAPGEPVPGSDAAAATEGAPAEPGEAAPDPAVVPDAATDADADGDGDGRADDGEEALAAAPAAASSDDGGDGAGALVGVVVGLLLIAAFGVGAVVRSRTTS